MRRIYADFPTIFYPRKSAPSVSSAFYSAKPGIAGNGGEPRVKSMKKLFLCLVLLILNTISAFAQEVKYTVSRNGWDTETLGNHRAIVRVNEAAKAVAVTIPWRRRDLLPEEKAVIVTDEKGAVINNTYRGVINREYGEIVFEPVSGVGRYYLYYLPYKSGGRSNYPNIGYLKPEQAAAAAWLELVNNDPNLPAATAVVTELQAVDELNSFYPMEVIATAAETQALLKANEGQPFLVFPEGRVFPIKMQRDLPQRWIKAKLNSFSGVAGQGEFFTFQLGVYALQDIAGVEVKFSDLKSGSGAVISAASFNCFNTGGINWDGKPFSKTVNIAAGNIQALWNGLDVPATTFPGVYSGAISVSAAGKPIRSIAFTLNILNGLKADGGISEPWNMTRLKWLNSTLAQKNEVIAPFTPLVIKGDSISLLGRKVMLGKDGLPAQIQTFFTPEMTALVAQPKNILAQPAQLLAETAAGPLKWQTKSVSFKEKSAGTVRWEALNTAPGLAMQVEGAWEFDGFAAYTIKLTATEDVSLTDIRLLLPYAKDSAKYMMGLGQKGGVRPENFKWKWEVATKNQDGAWLGEVNAGLMYSLRGENYARPLNTNFYLQKPLNLPPSWGNEGKGGIRITESNNIVTANNYSGSRMLKKGETLWFNFNLLITPFHTLDTDWQWANRFYHRYTTADEIKATGATVVNIHHANAINPYINYPFIEHEKMKAYIAEAHRQGLKVKIYNTVRELSNRAYEWPALRSLGHEIYSPGKGGGYSWLQEHLGEDYIAAWFVPELKDAAIVNSGMSRWHNYYVEGLNWLVNNVGIDGLYIDDVAFDRATMKRVKRVLTQGGHPGLIDLHSANQYNKNDGFNNSAMLYMEHFPYLNRLWFGEYFDYEKNGPEFYLTEVSGIPFGLMGEMLEGGGNPWRGMIYGMTNRMPWTTNSDPRPLWKVWDDFGMQGTKMIGYWVERNPVKTSRPDALATVYKKNGATLIALASWAESDVNVKLAIDWKALGLDAAKATITAPEVTNFQTGRAFKPDEEIPVPKGKGWLLIIK